MSIYHILDHVYSYNSNEEEEENIHTSFQCYGSKRNRRTRIFNVTFFGKSILTTITSKPSEIKNWIYSSLYHNRYHRYILVVELGVQCSTNASDDPAETLQICIGTRCLIIQLSHSPYVPKILRRFLGNVNITFVGIWNYSDNSNLLNSKHQLSVSKLINLSNYRTENHPSSGSMENLVRDHLGFEGVRKDERIGRSNWNAKYLSCDQVEYPTVDAHASFEIGKKVRAWMEG
ncbi:hypothetical protein MKW94_017000 [Papaver nudicaule]|uniref:3'-5' exonuclease domain-containing protein n=1 Tax=Papaver nudicaule TaxID=74823 RepID=A0AA41VQ96_PAPNU|nr:hypothetical protein [Papaver nudicaule]